MTVGELIKRLEQYRDGMEVVLEASRLGEDDTSGIHDIQEDYLGRLHIIAADGIKDRT